MSVVKFFMNAYSIFLLINCMLFVSNIYSMQMVSKASWDDKQLVSCFFKEFSSNESLRVVSALVRVNNQYNKEFNDSGFTRTFIRFVSDTYRDCYEADIVKKLQTKGAQNYYELSEQLIALQPSNSRTYKYAIEQLIEKGADVRYRKLKNFWCSRGFIECPLLFPLSHAVARNLTSVVPLLIGHGADVRWCGATLLNMAIEHRNAKIVKILLKNGIVIDNPRKGISSVARAVRCGDIPILKIFLDYGIDVNRPVDDCLGIEYPLYIAANAQKWDVVQFLCKNGASAGRFEALEYAKYIKRFRVNDLRNNKGNIRAGLIPVSRKEFIADVQKIKRTQRFLLQSIINVEIL